MSRPSQPPHIFQRLPTAALGQVGILLWVLGSKILDATSITEGTTLDTFCSTFSIPRDDPQNDDFGSYILSPTPPQDNNAGYLGYTFSKPSSALSTNLEDQTPIYERTIWWKEKMEWPSVLRWLRGFEGTAAHILESGASGASSTSNKQAQTFAVDMFDLVPGGYFPTQVTVRKYITPALITSILLERPHPTSVRYSYLGMSNNLECLHDDVIVPPLLINQSPIEGFGTEDAPDLSRGQLFPRTNFLTWQPYLFAADQPEEPRNGVFETTTYEALPPIMPKAQEL